MDAPHGGFFGDPIESAGDINGDGYGDLIAAAHEAQAPGGTGAVGRAYVYVGTETGAMLAVPLQDPNPRNEARFGFGVAGLGDINGDGFDDFAVGDPLDVPNRAHVYLGGDDVPTTPTFALTAPTSVDARQFGYWIALAPARRLHERAWRPFPSFAR
ncbi:MAG: integrin alpha [Polyangiales bacterium]